jgi:hypothetical protein
LTYKITEQNHFRNREIKSGVKIANASILSPRSKFRPIEHSYQNLKSDEDNPEGEEVNGAQTKQEIIQRINPNYWQIQSSSPLVAKTSPLNVN